jgi:ribosomal protein S3
LAALLFAGTFVVHARPATRSAKYDHSRACYGVLRFVMESGAKGCEVVVSGKLRAARAKSMKFTDGFMIHSGQPARDFVDYAVRHVLLRQGVLGIKVKMYVLCAN